MIWKEKKRKNGKIYYYNVITHKIHPYFRGDLASKNMYTRKSDTKQSHPYLRGGGLTLSRMMYPRRPVPNEEPELLKEAEDELASLVCHVSQTLIVDQPVSIDSIDDDGIEYGGLNTDAMKDLLIGTDRNPLIYSESAVRDWFRQVQAYGGDDHRPPSRIYRRRREAVLILTPQPDRIRDTARFVERIIHTRYQGSGWDQLRVQCAGYLELIGENGNEVALVAQEEAHTYETDRIERERARANALGDAPAIAFAIEEQEVREAQVIAREGAREAHAEAGAVEAEIAGEAVPEDCPICLEGMEGTVSILECNHYIHTECVTDLIGATRGGGTPQCPTCRSIIRLIPPRTGPAPAPQVPVRAPVEARDHGIMLGEEEIRARRETALQQQQAERDRLAGIARAAGWEVYHEEDLVPVAREPREEWPAELPEVAPLVREPSAPAPCSVCIEAMEGMVSLLECGHYFHENCIQGVIRANPWNPRCPNCRQDIRRNPPRLAPAPLPGDAVGIVRDVIRHASPPRAAPSPVRDEIRYPRDIRDILPRAAPRPARAAPRLLDDDALERERIRRVELSQQEYERRRRAEGRASPPRAGRAERERREREEAERREIERIRRVELSRQDYERRAREAARPEEIARRREEAARLQEIARRREAARLEEIARRRAAEEAEAERRRREAVEEAERLEEIARRREAERRLVIARRREAEEEAARQEAARQEAARQEAARQEAARQEAARVRLGEAARREAERRIIDLTLIIPAGRPNWFQGVSGTGVNWTAGGWMFVNGQWVDPPNGWLTRANPGGVHYPHPAPTLPPPSIPGNWVWNTSTNGWDRLVDPSPNPSPDWPNWWQGPPEVNWTAGGWMFVNGEWVEPTNGWMTRANPGGVNYEHPAPTLAPPLEPGDWFWNNDTRYGSLWERWPTVRHRRRR